MNDYADVTDGHVNVRSIRPLPSGAAQRKKRGNLFVVLVLLAFLLVLTLNATTILLPWRRAMLVRVYPFMKRYTHLPQVVLGPLSAGQSPLAFAAVSESPAIELLADVPRHILGGGLRDTQYAMVDRDDDIKIVAKSTAHPVWSL